MFLAAVDQEFEKLLVEILGTARSLQYLRGIEAPLGEWLSSRNWKIVNFVTDDHEQKGERKKEVDCLGIINSTQLDP